MRKILGVSLLVLLLTGSASAGEMPNWITSPPPQPANTVQDATANDITQNDGASLTEVALDLLAVLPSLF